MNKPEEKLRSTTAQLEEAAAELAKAEAALASNTDRLRKAKQQIESLDAEILQADPDDSKSLAKLTAARASAGVIHDILEKTREPKARADLEAAREAHAAAELAHDEVRFQFMRAESLRADVELAVYVAEIADDSNELLEKRREKINELALLDRSIRLRRSHGRDNTFDDAQGSPWADRGLSLFESMAAGLAGLQDRAKRAEFDRSNLEALHRVWGSRLSASAMAVGEDRAAYLVTAYPGVPVPGLSTMVRPGETFVAPDENYVPPVSAIPLNSKAREALAKVYADYEARGRSLGPVPEIPTPPKPPPPAPEAAPPAEEQVPSKRSADR